MHNLLFSPFQVNRIDNSENHCVKNHFTSAYTSWVIPNSLVQRTAILTPIGPNVFFCSIQISAVSFYCKK